MMEQPSKLFFILVQCVWCITGNFNDIYDFAREANQASHLPDPNTLQYDQFRSHPSTSVAQYQNDYYGRGAPYLAPYQGYTRQEDLRLEKIPQSNMVSLGHAFVQPKSIWHMFPYIYNPLGNPSPAQFQVISPGSSQSHRPEPIPSSNPPPPTPEILPEEDSEVKSEDLLMPYYFIAVSKYPYQHKKNPLDLDVIAIIQEILRRSTFKIALTTFEVLDKLFFAQSTASRSKARNAQKATSQGFLIRFCLRNAAFLFDLVGKNSEHLIVSEMQNTLDWLHPLPDGNFTPPHHPDLEINQILQDHLEAVYEPGSFAQLSHKNGKKTVNLSVSEYEAKENRAIILALEKYYQSTNGKKWKQLFHEKNTFQKYYVKQTVNQFHHKRQKRWEDHWNNFKGKNLLPWKDDSNFNLPSVNLDTLFDNPSALSVMIQSFVRNGGKHWKQLIRHEIKTHCLRLDQIGRKKIFLDF